MSGVARRYAKAIFALAREQGELETVGPQLRAAAAEMAVPELAEVASSPRLTAERRHALVEAVSAQLQLSPVVATFLALLADSRRLGELGHIADHFQGLEDEALGRVRMRIRSAVPLSDGQRDQIAASFERQLGRTVLASTETDPSLLGGVVVEADGKVYDGSVLSQLDRLAKQLAHPDTH